LSFGLFAQTPPHPNGGGAPGGGTPPVGGGAPIDGGLTIMMVLGAAYAGVSFRANGQAREQEREIPQQ
ncbi:MAG: hypothetical protein DRJ05_13505, partial [Bacteroidetes bacterium]